MTFKNIYWLYAFIPVLLVLLIGFYHSQKIRRRFFESLLAPKLQENLMSTYSPERYLAKSVLFLLSIFFLFLALAQPQWGYNLVEQKSKGIDILFALDVSKSMLAEDIRPNRLERAKYSILDLINKLNGDRFGLITFSGNAFLQCPLTLDYTAFRESLEQADPSLIFRGGTNIGAAIRVAEPVFAKEDNFKILILITDGEDLQESGITEANIAAKNDVKIYTVGVGTTQGELIPIKNKDGSSDYLRDSEGKIVKTKLDETTLRKIAEVTGGFYVPLGPKGEGLDQIYYSGLKNIPQRNLSSNLKQTPIEQFQWPLAIAILLLCIETLLSTRRNSDRKKLSIRPIKTFALLIATLFVLGLNSKQLEASLSDAYKAYQNGQFEKSATLYEKALRKDLENNLINYNLGSSLYKSKNYASAANSLKNSLKTEDLELQQKAFYNLGNTHFRWGEQSLQTNPGQSISFWEEALKDYQNAIELDPKDLKCQENFEFVKKKLEKLKQQQNQNQQQNKEEKEENNQDQSNSESTPKDNSQNDSNKNDNQTEKQDQNTESSPKPESDEQNKNDNQQQNNNNPKTSSDGKQQESEQQPRRRMNKEEAGELLESLKNLEKTLPAVNLQMETNNLSDNFKDW